jgi:hypothetical protein
MADARIQIQSATDVERPFVVRSLDDAVRFIVDYHQARRPEMQTGVLHRLEGRAMKLKSVTRLTRLEAEDLIEG